MDSLFCGIAVIVFDTVNGAWMVKNLQHLLFFGVVNLQHYTPVLAIYKTS